MSLFLALIKETLKLAPLFIFGSTGETLTEKSGHLNLGVPGVMCMGAGGGMLGIFFYNMILGGNSANCNPAIAFMFCAFFALLFGVLSGVLFSFFTVSLRCNQNVMGLTLTTFGIGAYTLIYEMITKSNMPVDIGDLSNYCRKFYTIFPTGTFADYSFGDILLNHGLLWFLSFVIGIVTAIILKKTRVGLSLRAVGENAASADAAGISVSKYRYLATIVGCGIASLGGLYYLLEMKIGLMEFSELDSFGWLAVALVIFTLWKTDLGILGAILFAFLFKLPSVYNLSNSALNILFSYLPYLVTVVILVIISLFDKVGSQAPGNLGISYFREDR